MKVKFVDGALVEDDLDLENLRRRRSYEVKHGTRYRSRPQHAKKAYSIGDDYFTDLLLKPGLAEAWKADLGDYHLEPSSPAYGQAFFNTLDDNIVSMIPTYHGIPVAETKLAKIDGNVLVAAWEDRTMTADGIQVRGNLFGNQVDFLMNYDETSVTGGTLTVRVPFQ